MIAEIPARFLVQAQRHLRQTGRPLVYGPRRRTDIGLLAIQNPASARWALATDTSTLPDILEEAILANEPPRGEPSADLMVRLTKYAAVAVQGFPSVFECHGCEVGRLQVCDGVPFLSDGLALSCLSYVLRHHDPRTGFFLRVGPRRDSPGSR